MNKCPRKVQTVKQFARTQARCSSGSGSILLHSCLFSHLQNVRAWFFSSLASRRSTSCRRFLLAKGKIHKVFDLFVWRGNSLNKKCNHASEAFYQGSVSGESQRDPQWLPHSPHKNMVVLSVYVEQHNNLYCVGSRHCSCQLQELLHQIHGRQASTTMQSNYSHRPGSIKHLQLLSHGSIGLVFSKFWDQVKSD